MAYKSKAQREEEANKKGVVNVEEAEETEETTDEELDKKLDEEDEEVEEEADEEEKEEEAPKKEEKKSSGKLPKEGPVTVQLPNGTRRTYTEIEHGPHYRELAKGYQEGQNGKFV